MENSCEDYTTFEIPCLLATVSDALLAVDIGKLEQQWTLAAVLVLLSVMVSHDK